mmetsp:Transcript_3748/g.9730  ORF Transcript_3748/g.9730 Transcript_3748/m.9730 type:complete len:229 (-) Transcript_3748:173-859(-)
MLGLQVPKKHRLQLAGCRVEHYRGHVKVHLPLVGVPAESDGNRIEILGKVEHSALLHRESDLLSPWRVGYEHADDLRKQRKDVHEVLPLLGVFLNDAQGPRARRTSEHCGDDVDACLAALHLEECYLVFLSFLEYVKFPAHHVSKVPPRVGRDDKDQERNVFGKPRHIHPNELVDASSSSGWLVAGMCDRSDCLQVVVIRAIDDGTYVVNHDALEVNVHLRSAWRSVP